MVVLLRARHAARAPSTVDFSIKTVFTPVSMGVSVIMGGHECSGGIGVLIRRNDGPSFFHRVDIVYKGEVGNEAMDSTGGGMFDPVAFVGTIGDPKAKPLSRGLELDR